MLPPLDNENNNNSITRKTMPNLKNLTKPQKHLLVEWGFILLTSMITAFIIYETTNDSVENSTSPSPSFLSFYLPIMGLTLSVLLSMERFFAVTMTYIDVSRQDFLHSFIAATVGAGTSVAITEMADSNPSGFDLAGAVLGGASIGMILTSTVKVLAAWWSSRERPSLTAEAGEDTPLLLTQSQSTASSLSCLSSAATAVSRAASSAAHSISNCVLSVWGNCNAYTPVRTSINADGVDSVSALSINSTFV
jgi:hypothetical protein